MTKKRRAFTMLEATAAIVMLAILSAIAIPTFFSVTSGAQDTTAEQSLLTVRIAARAIANAPGNYASYPAATITDLSTTGNVLPANLAVMTGASTSPYLVSGVVVSPTQLLLAAKSPSGNCFVMLDNPSTQVTTWAVSSTGTCIATGAIGLVGSIAGTMSTQNSAAGPSTISLP